MVKYSLQKKIFVLALCFMLIPLILFSVFNIFTAVKKVEENYRSSLIFGMKKVGSMTESIFDDIDQASLFVLVNSDIKQFLENQTEKDPYERTAEMRVVYNNLNYLKNTNDSIQSIQIAGVNGEILSNGYFPQNITKQDWKEAEVLNGQSHWAIDEIELLGEKEKKIYQSRLLRNPDDTSETVGLAKIYLNTDALQNLFENEATSYTSYFIMDKMGKIQYSSVPEGGPQLEDSSILYERLYEENDGIIKLTEKDNKELYAVPHFLSANGWIVYSLSEPVSVRIQLRDSLFQLLILIIFCFIFCFLIASIISRRMCRPLKNITKHMKLLEEQQFSTRVEVKGNDEISLLACQFNAMAGKIQSLIEEVYLVSLRKKELEMRALHAQVNPHFLYNTLDMIYWTAKMEHAFETSEMISSLSCFFRQALAGEDEFTTIENEIEHLRYYIILRQQSRHSFDFDLDVDEKILSCRVIKLILQPLVENAILHGIQDLEHGRIWVKIFSSGNDIIYTITDNGKGVDISDMNALLTCVEKNNRGFGIKNINDRIQLIYGKEYGIYFENVTEGGAKITVTQPQKEK